MYIYIYTYTHICIKIYIEASPAVGRERRTTLASFLPHAAEYRPPPRLRITDIPTVY